MNVLNDFMESSTRNHPTATLAIFLIMWCVVVTPPVHRFCKNTFSGHLNRINADLLIIMSLISTVIMFFIVAFSTSIFFSL